MQNINFRNYVSNSFKKFKIYISILLSFFSLLSFLIFGLNYLLSTSGQIVNQRYEEFSFWVQTGDQFHIQRALNNINEVNPKLNLTLYDIEGNLISSTLKEEARKIEQDKKLEKVTFRGLKLFYNQRYTLYTKFGAQKIGLIFTSVEIPVFELLGLLVFIFLASFFIIDYLSRSIEKSTMLICGPLENLTNELSQKNTYEEISQIKSVNIVELNELIIKFKNLGLNIKDREEKLKLQEVNKGREELATQVAHDIRSPLAALNAAMKFTSEISDTRKTLIFNSIHRIQSIANQLLHFKTKTTQVEILKSAYKFIDLKEEINSIINEKKYEYIHKSEIEINFNISENTKNFNVFLPPDELQRVMSNLINNSIDSLDKSSSYLTINLDLEYDFYLIKICDNGKGIPPSVIEKVVDKGFSYGKENSSGLGLYHALTTLNSWGGKLTVESEVFKGTVITLYIPNQNNVVQGSLLDPDIGPLTYST